MVLYKSRLVHITLALALLTSVSLGAFAQRGRSRRASQTSHPSNVLSPESREMVELASVAVCRERLTDPKASVPIDEMQARPSLPVNSVEAVAGARRAERLLPVTKALVVDSLRRLAAEYRINGQSGQARKIQAALARVAAVRHIRPDVASRDNASVFMHNPRTIVFGTIFLAGLPSDEGVISVLSHELVHIADGDRDSLSLLFRSIGQRASKLTNQTIQDQKAEELTCDLVGMLAARAYVTRQPSYEPLSRRIARSVAHNCVEEDEGDEDHLSPKSTIRTLLALNPNLARELVYGR